MAAQRDDLVIVVEHEGWLLLRHGGTKEGDPLFASRDDRDPADCPVALLLKMECDQDAERREAMN